MENRDMAKKFERFLFLLSSAIRSKFKEEVKNLDDRVTEQQFKVLMVLMRREICKACELSDIIGVSPGSMSIMVNSLVDEGYVMRLYSDEDRRVVLLKLTQKGDAVVKGLYDRILAMIGDTIGRLSREEQDSLEVLLDKLLASISKNK
jgi:MarR family 2-MHQ and catechol resistance regulon transcriptional repressor